MVNITKEAISIIENAASITRGDYKTVDMETLKIMVVSTPKTGNTWIKHLLSTIYDLPIQYLSEILSSAEVDRAGSRWIAQQHYYPQSELLGWAEQNQVVFVTTVRHPGDVLISLYHHNVNYAHDQPLDTALQEAASLDGYKFGKHTVSYVENEFFLYLNLSIAWIHSGISYLVRYEDLWHDPVATLQHLTSLIQRVPDDYIERAIERCDINFLRKKNVYQAKFYRQGGVGNWRQDLPDEIIKIFRKVEPYPRQFAALGYTLDTADLPASVPAKPRPSNNPFREITHFDNGIAVQPIIVDLYLSLDSDLTTCWSDVSSTQAHDSFFAWLNAPSAKDLYKHEAVPIISNLATHIYHTRPDLRANYPDVYGQHRIGYIRWFIQHAQKEFGLDSEFMRSVYEGFLTWSIEPAPEDPYRDSSVPMITNLADYIYHTRPTLQALFPELYSQSRIGYIMWFLQHAQQEYQLDNTIMAAVHDSFLEWSIAPSAVDPYKLEAVPCIPNLAAYIHSIRPDLKTTYPDLYGQHRIDYASWFILRARSEYNLGRAYILPVIQSWAECIKIDL